MNPPKQEFSLYALLNVDKKATQQEIRKSYKQLALQFHPDKNQGDQEAKEKFQKIVDAYQILSNEEKKTLYDETGAVDNLDQFKNAYDYFRNLFPKVTLDDINAFEEKYRFSKEEEEDLIKFYNQKKGDMKGLLENIILSKNEDIPRFLEFYDSQLAQNKLINYKSYSVTRKRIRKLNEEKIDEDFGDLQSQITQRHNKKGNIDDLFTQLEQKYCKKGKKQNKTIGKIQKQQK